MNKLSKIIIGLLVAILIEVVGFGGWYILKNEKESNEKIGNLENQVAEINKTSSSKKEESKENKIIDEEAPVGTIVYEDGTIVKNDDRTEMTIEDKAMLMYYCPDFSKAEKLTSEELIAIMYSAINRCLVPNLEPEGSAKTEDTDFERTYYIEADIKKAIMDIFGVTLKENVSANLEYVDGKYFFSGADGDPIPCKVDMTKREADGTIIYDCVLYTEDVMCEVSEAGRFTMTIDKETGHILSKVSKK